MILQIFDKYKVTTTIVAPYVLSQLLSCDETSRFLNNNVLKAMMVGGTPLSKQMYDKAKLSFPNCDFCHVYASTEGGLLSVNLSNVKCESTGQLTSNIVMKES